VWIRLTVVLYVLGIVRAMRFGHPRISDPAPTDHVRVPSVGGVGEEPFRDVAANHPEELAAVELVEAVDLARRPVADDRVLLVG